MYVARVEKSALIRLLSECPHYYPKEESMQEIDFKKTYILDGVQAFV